MRIHAEVLAVETKGDTLAVRLQGSTENAAQWRGMVSLSIELPCVDATQRAYHVGRLVTIDVEPKRAAGKGA